MQSAADDRYLTLPKADIHAGDEEEFRLLRDQLATKSAMHQEQLKELQQRLQVR